MPPSHKGLRELFTYPCPKLRIIHSPTRGGCDWSSQQYVTIDRQLNAFTIYDASNLQRFQKYSRM